MQLPPLVESICSGGRACSRQLVSADSTVADFHDSLSSLCNVMAVSDDDQRHVVVFVKRGEELQNLFPGRGIEVPGGFIGQQHIRSICEGACNRDALSFTNRQLCRQMRGTMFEANNLQQFLGTLFALRCRQTRFEHWQLDILDCGQRWQQIERLKDVANVLGPQLVEAAARRDLLPVKEDSP